MSDSGQTRKSRLAQVTSGSPLTSDIAQGARQVRFVPEADSSFIERKSSLVGAGFSALTEKPTC